MLGSLQLSSAQGIEEGKTARPQTRRPVDLVHLARYTLGNRSLEREVLELFCTQSKLYLRRLRDAATEQAWRDAAHTIKGSARGIGAWRVAQTAEAAESLQGGVADGPFKQLVAALEKDIDEADAFIRLLLSDA